MARRAARLEIVLLLAIGLVVVGLGGATLFETRRMTACSSGASPERTKLELGQLLHEALPRWALAHPSQRCPVWIGELTPFVASHELDDRWGHRIELYCGVAVSSGRWAAWARSAGPDGELATDDDIVVAN